MYSTSSRGISNLDIQEQRSRDGQILVITICELRLATKERNARASNVHWPWRGISIKHIAFRLVHPMTTSTNQMVSSAVLTTYGMLASAVAFEAPHCQHPSRQDVGSTFVDTSCRTNLSMIFHSAGTKKDVNCSCFCSPSS